MLINIYNENPNRAINLLFLQVTDPRFRQLIVSYVTNINPNIDLGIPTEVIKFLINLDSEPNVENLIGIRDGIRRINRIDPQGGVIFDDVDSSNINPLEEFPILRVPIYEGITFEEMVRDLSSFSSWVFNILKQVIINYINEIIRRRR